MSVIFRLWLTLKNRMVTTWCGRKLMRLARLCTNRKRCCLPFTWQLDSVQVWTCCSCYAMVDSVWSGVCEVRYQNRPAEVWAMLCQHILCKARRIRYCDLWKATKGFWRTFPIQGTSVQMAQVLFRRPRKSRKRTSCEKKFNLKNGRKFGKSEVYCEVWSSIDVENDQ